MTEISPHECEHHPCDNTNKISFCEYCELKICECEDCKTYCEKVEGKTNVCKACIKKRKKQNPTTVNKIYLCCAKFVKMTNI